MTLRPADASYVGELAFASVTSTRELADGSLLVADRAERRILHLQWDGSEPRAVGRVGDGPGEYRQPGWLYAMGGDATLFTDEYSGRWLMLRHNQVVSTISEGGALNLLLGGELAGASDRGKILGLADALRRVSSDSLTLVLADLVSGRADTIARVRARRGGRFTMLPRTASGRDAVLIGNPLETEEQALLLPDGWIALARLDPYRVDWRSPDGRWTLGAPLPFQRRSVDRAERCWAIERIVRTAATCTVDVAGWPETVPPFVPRGPNRALLPLLAAPDGRLVIARRSSRVAPESRYDFIDRSGRLTGVLVLPGHEALLGFGRGSLYVASADADGIATVRRHPWP